MRVVLTAPQEEHVAERLRAAGVEVDVVTRADRERLREAVRDAEALLCHRLERGDLDGAERLRLVQALSAGADAVDRSALPPGCALCNVHEHERAIAEWALLGMLALSRRLLVHDRALREGDWRRGDTFVPRELRGRVLGCVGWGHIARETATLAAALGMKVAAVTRTPSPERAGVARELAPLDALPGLLRAADFLLVAVPLTDGTRGLVGARELDLLGPDAFLLNPARGEVVDERALYEALRDRRIAGAAIDTWYRYPRGSDAPVPPSELPFGELDNVVMTPHNSGWTEETRAGRAAFVLAQLGRLERGEPLLNLLATG
ncbi:MAG TPA: 2-hydroxyacid dehydrogenase [Gaiellaceae bacterium]|nr:2-hydroxyacid dehydrogenase [Gaiellaceae bacterium]